MMNTGGEEESASVGLVHDFSVQHVEDRKLISVKTPFNLDPYGYGLQAGWCSICKWALSLSVCSIE